MIEAGSTYLLPAKMQPVVSFWLPLLACSKLQVWTFTCAGEHMLRRVTSYLWYPLQLKKSVWNAIYTVLLPMNFSSLLLKSCHKAGRLKTTTATKPSLYFQVDAEIFSLSQVFQVEDSGGIIKAINLVCLAEVTLEKLQKRLGNLSRKKNVMTKGGTTVLVL